MAFHIHLIKFHTAWGKTTNNRAVTNVICLTWFTEEEKHQSVTRHWEGLREWNQTGGCQAQHIHLLPRTSSKTSTCCRPGGNLAPITLHWWQQTPHPLWLTDHLPLTQTKLTTVTLLWAVRLSSTAEGCRSLASQNISLLLIQWEPQKHLYQLYRLSEPDKSACLLSKNLSKLEFSCVFFYEVK